MSNQVSWGAARPVSNHRAQSFRPFRRAVAAALSWSYATQRNETLQPVEPRSQTT